MDGNVVQSFAAINQFVSALGVIYVKKKKVTPLILYQRLLTFVKPDAKEHKNIQKFLRGFYTFFRDHNNAIVSNRLPSIPRHTRIVYSKNAYIDIQKFIYKSGDQPHVLNQIRVHLLTIQAFLETDDAKADVLLRQVSASESTSVEDKFVDNIVQKAQDAIEHLDPGSVDNPMAAVAGLMQSGVLKDMIEGLQSSVGSGDMDPARLLQSMQGTMAKVLVDSRASLGDYEDDEPVVVTEKGDGDGDGDGDGPDAERDASGITISVQAPASDCQGDSCPV